MGTCKLFHIFPLNGERNSAWIEPSESEHVVPDRYPAVPGYVDRMMDAAFGRIDPWWGVEYAGYGAFPADFVETIPSSITAVSDRFRALLEENGVVGARFHPIRVDRTISMHLMVLTGRVEVNSKAFELQLLDGAEIGQYKVGSIHVSPRVMSLVRKAGIPLYYWCAVSNPHGSSSPRVRRSPR